MTLSRFGITFLRGGSELSEDERSDLLHAATAMYLSDLSQRDVTSDRFAGRITAGKYQNLGSFGGQHFSTALELNGYTGKLRLDFLVTEVLANGAFTFTGQYEQPEVWN